MTGVTLNVNDAGQMYQFLMTCARNMQAMSSTAKSVTNEVGRPVGVGVEEMLVAIIEAQSAILAALGGLYGSRLQKVQIAQPNVVMPRGAG